MNLKEAFRYQNKIQSLMDDAQAILSLEGNVTRVENTALRHKVNPEDQDETTLETPETEFAHCITQVALLLMRLLDERETLSRAIRDAKQSAPLDFDSQVSLNTKRQEIAQVLRRMCQIRAGEVLHPRGGVGYKFNAEGNQVSYRCDLKTVTTINFDRNKIRSLAAGLTKRADQISAQLDSALVNIQVDYQPPFDVNDTFAEVLEQFLDSLN